MMNFSYYHYYQKAFVNKYYTIFDRTRELQGVPYIPRPIGSYLQVNGQGFWEILQFFYRMYRKRIGNGLVWKRIANGQKKDSKRIEKGQQTNRKRIGKGFSSFFYPFSIRFLFFCDPILFLSFLGFQLWYTVVGPHRIFMLISYPNKLAILFKLSKIEN